MEKQVNINKLLSAVTKVFECSIEEIQGQIRPSNVTDARTMICGILKENGYENQYVSDIIKRKPNNIASIARRHKDFLSFDKKYNNKYNEVKNMGIYE